MHAAPNNESPVGTMPDAANKKSHENVPIVAQFRASAATHRDIDIVFEPCR